MGFICNPSTPTSIGAVPTSRKLKAGRHARIDGGAESPLTADVTITPDGPMIPSFNQAGRYYPPDTMGFATTTGGGVFNGSAWFVPFSRKIPIDALVSEITFNGIGGGINIRHALYSAHDTTRLPDVLIYDLGNKFSAYNVVGNIISLLPATYTPTDMLWLALMSDAPNNLLLRVGGNNNVDFMSQMSGAATLNINSNALVNTHLKTTLAFGAYPANCNALAFALNADRLQIAARCA